jgi:hypothetical protein
LPTQTLQHLQSSDAQARVEIGAELANLRPQVEEKPLSASIIMARSIPDQALIGTLAISRLNVGLWCARRAPKI